MELRSKIIKAYPSAVKYVDTYLPYINKFAEEFGITTEKRMNHFLAQVLHESSGFARIEENLNYSANRLVVVFPKYFNAKNASLYAHKPRKIASRVYANRMGNNGEASMDGYTFRGRGLIQITGRTNYALYRNYCGYDVVANPDLLAKPLGAVRSAMWYWYTHGLNEIADKDDIITITKRINGGTNGLKERRDIYDELKKVA